MRSSKNMSFAKLTLKQLVRKPGKTDRGDHPEISRRIPGRYIGVQTTQSVVHGLDCTFFSRWPWHHHCGLSHLSDEPVLDRDHHVKD
jgi:hypothetical protein